MTFSNIEQGEVYEDSSLKVFFGNGSSSDIFKSTPIHFGHQVHGHDLLKLNTINKTSSHQIQDSDGLWTEVKNLKLGLYTADCIPCFIHSTNKMFALHLGWRGLHSGLLEAALSKIEKKSKLKVFIGPHIRSSSFEVGYDVLNKFKILMGSKNSLYWATSGPDNKYYISLERLIELKLREFKADIHSPGIDTKISQKHHSYRRENGTSERNISFAFLK